MRRINTAQVRRTLRGIFGPSVIKLLEWMVSRRSWEATQTLGRRLGRLGCRLQRRHRENAVENVRRAFGEELSPERVEEIVRQCFEHLTMLFLEALRTPSMSREDLAEVVRISGAEHLRAALEAGNGVVMFSGHFGNWEIGALRGIYEGFPVIPLSRAARNPRLARTITGIRDKLGLPVIPIEQGARGILRALKDNQIVPIMADRFARGDGLTVPFFGQETHVWHTPALMAQRAGCPIIPAHAIRQPDGSYVVEIDPPIEQQDTGDRDYDVWVTTARTMALLEAKLREHPEQFTWPYRLWRPPERTPPSPYPFEALVEAAGERGTQEPQQEGPPVMP